MPKIVKMESRESFMERRGLPRLPIDDATVRFKHLAAKLFWSKMSPHFKLHNLSKSGLSFSTKFPVKSGDKLLLKICFANGDCVQLKSIVKWIKEHPNLETFHVGVQFLPFGSHKEYNDLNALEYLRKLLPNNSRFMSDETGDSLELS